MKYFVNESERRKTGSTCFIEFQRGVYDGIVWSIEAVFIDEEIFYDLKLRKLFTKILPSFDYYGITQVHRSSFEKVKAAASDFLPETAECLNELDEWLKADSTGYDVFTIIGM